MKGQLICEDEGFILHIITNIDLITGAHVADQRNVPRFRISIIILSLDSLKIYSHLYLLR